MSKSALEFPHDASVEQPGTPGLGAVCRIDRSALAAATAEPTVPSAWLWLRLCARRHVRPARTTMGTGRPARPRRMAGSTAAVQAARRGRNLPHPALRAVAAGDLAVLPHPHQHLESDGRTNIDEFADRFATVTRWLAR